MVNSYKMQLSNVGGTRVPVITVTLVIMNYSLYIKRKTFHILPASSILYIQTLEKRKMQQVSLTIKEISL